MNPLRIGNRDLLLLFLMLYIAYNLNGHLIGSGDTIPASLLPLCMLENHNLYLDNFYVYLSNANSSTYFLLQARGHFLSAYPVVTPVLVTPFYLIPFLLLKLIHYPIDPSNPGFLIVVHIMEKLAGSLIAAIAGVFVFLSLRELIDRRTAFIGTLIFAFATDTWAISSQALWQHGLTELLLAASIYIVLRNERHPSKANISLLGVFSGLFIFNRPAECILLLPVLYYVLDLKDLRIGYYFGSMALFGGPFLLYNMYYFNSPFGGYSILLNNFGLGPNNLISLAGLLISPSRGLLVYSPILILSVAGYFQSFHIENRRIRSFLLIFGLSIFFQLLIYSSFATWWAGWCYGPRFLTGMLPALAVFVGLQIKNYTGQKFDWKKAPFICLMMVLLLWSFFVQIVGVFYYPNGNWDSDPSVDVHPERVWDLHDTQIGRSFYAGFVPPINPREALEREIDLRNGIKRVIADP